MPRKQCHCGSYAINQGIDDREDDYPDLCDVCYWKYKYLQLVVYIDSNRFRFPPGHSIYNITKTS